MWLEGIKNSDVNMIIVAVCFKNISFTIVFTIVHWHFTSLCWCLTKPKLNKLLNKYYDYTKWSYTIQREVHYQIRFLKRKLTSRGDLGFLLAVIWMSAPSTSMCWSTLAMFFVSSMPRWCLPTKGICSSFIIVTIPVACYPLWNKHVILYYIN